MTAAGSPTDGLQVWLKVCVTCDRYAPVQGLLGGKLAEALEKAHRGMGETFAATLRRVPCLSGCKHPGNVALEGPARWKIRLHGLRADDAADLATLAGQYVLAPDGDVPIASWPAALRDKLAVLVPPR